MILAVKTAKMMQKATKVRVAGPQRGELIEFVSAPGTVEAKSQVSISARVSARILDLPFEEGEIVTKGDPDANPPVPASVLVRLDASELEASLRSTQARRDAQAAQIRVAEANIEGQRSRVTGVQATLADARRNLERQQELHAAGDVSRSALERAQVRVEEVTASLKSSQHTLKSQLLNLDVMEHQVAAADAEIAQATDRLSHTTITSPIDGTVTLLRAEVGELAMTGTMNNPGTVIVQVADLSRMLVVAVLDEADIGVVREGQRVVARMRAYPDEEFTGVVESIALVGIAGRTGNKEFQVEILLDASQRQIYLGLSADVEIETKRYEDVLRVPSQAVLARKVDELPTKIREDNPNVDTRKTFATVVYRIIKGKAVVTPVKVGASDPTHTVIKSGLDESDKVIVGSYKVLEKLKHHQKVEDEKKGEAPTRPATKPADTQPAATQPAATQPTTSTGAMPPVMT